MNVLESFSLNGKVALLTGGAGLYGRQLAEALAEAGAVTVIASRNVAELEKVAETLRAVGGDVTALPLDLEDEASIHALITEIERRWGRLDVLVNNAVTRCACADWDQPMAVFDRSLHVNGSALFCLTRLAAELMKRHQSGSIINIGSYMGLRGPDPLNYVGTEMMKTPSPIYFFEKGGMVNFTRFAASVLGPFGIRVNALHPGGFLNNQPEAFIKNYSANTMLGRLANDSDLKGAVVFLASDASCYLTGTNIPVDGGYTAK
ncbi:MAG TPA: SDR family oxidoreductase [Kiritimatiellia bacterium]|nr:SDR family oxidoreductase [Kiritimatiellia bacterium]HRU69515.1 SDR family oxidoreductase [Kiritimatiellia bacterium]